MDYALKVQGGGKAESRAEQRACNAYDKPLYHENLHYAAGCRAEALQYRDILALFHHDHYEGAYDVEGRDQYYEREYDEHGDLLEFSCGEEGPVHLHPC